MLNRPGYRATVLSLGALTAAAAVYAVGAWGAVTPQTPDAPKLPNGFSWDIPAIEERFHSVRIDTHPGDLFLLASGRCLHRVNKVAGPRARVTMGGFLALDKDNRRVYCWS